MYEEFPEDLKSQFRWVIATPSEKKIPSDAETGHNASVSNPDTWNTFGFCLEQLGRFPKGSLLGYVFSDIDDIIGIDIDKGFDENGTLSALALDIILHTKSYTEYSRSRRGFHIFVRGKIPFNGCNNRQGVEIYNTGRYFICTGNAFGSYSLIENQNAIDYIVEKYFRQINNQISMEEGILSTTIKEKYFRPEWKQNPIENGRVQIRPTYPVIGEGSRNQSLTSLAGQLARDGYEGELLLNELNIANQRCCDPPLPIYELRQICRSVKRYV